MVTNNSGNKIEVQDNGPTTSVIVCLTCYAGDAIAGAFFWPAILLLAFLTFGLAFFKTFVFRPDAVFALAFFVIFFAIITYYFRTI